MKRLLFAMVAVIALASCSSKGAAPKSIVIHYSQLNSTKAVAEQIAKDLDVPFKRIGAMVCCLHEEDMGHLRELYDRGVFSEAIDQIRADSKKYKSAFTKNYKRWSNMSNKAPLDYELNREAFACKNEEESAEQLARWLEKRIDFMNGVWHR